MPISEEEQKAIEWVNKNKDIFPLNAFLNYMSKLQIQVEESEKALVREREFKNKEIDRLQKENEELKNADLTIVYMNGFYDSESKWKTKIKDEIENCKKELEKIEKGEEFENEKSFYEYGIFFLEDLLKEN